MDRIAPRTRIQYRPRQNAPRCSLEARASHTRIGRWLRSESPHHTARSKVTDRCRRRPTQGVMVHARESTSSDSCNSGGDARSRVHRSGDLILSSRNAEVPAGALAALTSPLTAGASPPELSAAHPQRLVDSHQSSAIRIGMLPLNRAKVTGRRRAARFAPLLDPMCRPLRLAKWRDRGDSLRSGHPVPPLGHDNSFKSVNLRLYPPNRQANYRTRTV